MLMALPFTSLETLQSRKTLQLTMERHGTKLRVSCLVRLACPITEAGGQPAVVGVLGLRTGPKGFSGTVEVPSPPSWERKQHEPSSLSQTVHRHSRACGCSLANIISPVQLNAKSANQEV